VFISRSCTECALRTSCVCNLHKWPAANLPAGMGNPRQFDAALTSEHLADLMRGLAALVTATGVSPRWRRWGMARQPAHSFLVAYGSDATQGQHAP